MVVEQGRYVGIDLGKRSWEMAVITRSGKCRRNEQGDLEPEERTAFYRGTMTAEGRLKLYKLLKAGDKVVVETGNLAFLMAKELERAAGCRVRVLSSHHLPIIYATDKKTDKEDSLKLAHLTADRPDSRLPIVPVPSDKEMEKRKVLSSYRRAQENRTRAINQIHGLFVWAGITAVGKKDLADAERRGEMIRHLSGFEREEAEYLAEILVIYERRIEELGQRMTEQSKGDKDIERLRGIPGVGPKIAYAFTAHVGAERFEHAGQVSNYLGLTPRVYMSGSLVRYGHITKRGNGYLRALLVQGAWALTWSKDGGALKERYEYMTREKGIRKKKAIVAIARRLGELMYTILKKKTDYEVRHLRVGRQSMGTLAREALSA